ncbi:hypothetical protein vseg_007036 [Gypsophila vaccaria]
MADWSHLPHDLLHEIETHLTTPISTVRLRSTCATWRHTLRSNGPHSSTSAFPHFLTKLSILILSPLSTKPVSWIVKLDTISSQRFNLFYPLSKTRVNPTRIQPPIALDMLRTRVFELGFEFSLKGSDLFGDCSLYTEKVAFLAVKNGEGKKNLLLTVHVSGKLAIFDDVSMKWNFVDEFRSGFDDVVSYNGDFYAVDSVGRAVVLTVNGVESNVCDLRVVADPVCGGGDKKRLVEMRGELVLVDVYIGLPPFEDGGVGEGGGGGGGGGNVVVLDEFVVSRSMWFRVYRLDWGRMRWVEVKDLGDNVLFLGVGTAFSATAHELCWEKGNCICFNFPGMFLPSTIGDGDGDEDEEVVKFHCGGVYDMEDCSISFAKVFWPPPSWVTSSS